MKQLLDAQASRTAVALITELESGEQRLVGQADIAGEPLSEALKAGFRFDRSGVHALDGREYFVCIQNPPLRLVVVGAVHIAQSVTPIAVSAGYDVTIVDPREAFATQERFPGVQLRPDWPDEVLPEMKLDARSAVLALTHDPKIDDPALLAALQSDCFYIGALGSKRNHANRLQRLAEQGADPTALARISGPVGLDIGARGTAEIAISIMAEMTCALRHGSMSPP